LQLLAGTGNVSEASLPVKPERQNSAGHPHGGLGSFECCSLGGSIFLHQLGRGRGPLELVGIRLVSPSLNLGKLLLALEILVRRFKRVQRRSPRKSSGSIAGESVAGKKGGVLENVV